MSSFTEPLILEALPFEEHGRGVFRVYEQFSYDVGHLGSNETITVPVGFLTDLASIPAIARPFIPLAGRLAKPALIHDWLLEQGADPTYANNVLDEALTVNGVGNPMRWTVVTACRIHWWFKMRWERLSAEVRQAA